MKNNSSSYIFGVVATLLLILTVCTTRADEFDTMRVRWWNFITGGSSFNTSDATVATRISTITNTAGTYWTSMNKNPTTYLWSDLQNATDSGQICTAYSRLYNMALAYNTYGSSYYHNATLSTDIKTGLDWMYANRYNENTTEVGNWWYWEIGTPLNLNSCVILMYDQLSSTQVTNYMKGVYHISPDPTMCAGLASTGANRAWMARICAARAILVKDDAKLREAMDSLSILFPNVASGDGFYADGSYMFHLWFAYTGGYAADQLDALSCLISVTANTTYQVSSTNVAAVYTWIYKAFAPIIYKGLAMDMSRGRGEGRSISDHWAGMGIISSIMRYIDSASTADALALKRMCKYWIAQDTYYNIMGALQLPDLVRAQTIMGDSSILPMDEPIRSYVFAGMGRMSHFRQGWAAAVSVNSSRTGAFEFCNQENGRGWYTSDGFLTIYTSDLGQFTDAFWPTVNPYRIPGTTVDTQTRAFGSGCEYNGSTYLSLSPFDWAGGATLTGQYTAMGMELKAWSSSLTARKSWFLFDQEVVALGANITSTDSRTIETIVENRRLNSTGNNALTVNGTTQPTNLTWSGTLSSTSWAHLQGNVAGGDIGYYFPNAVTLSAVREARTGSWHDLTLTESTTSYTRNYLTLWMNHGTNPTAATYSYVVLPNQSAASVAAYASAPRVQILANNATVQAVKHTPLNITAANVWTDEVTTVSSLITADKCCSLLVKDGNTMVAAVSDPTQTNTGSINVTVNKLGTSIISADSGISVTQLSPCIKFSANVYGALGKTFQLSVDSWNYTNVGAVGLTGCASYSGGVFSVSGSGAGITGTADQCYYVYRKLAGDGQFIARIASLGRLPLTARAGIMMRETTDSGAKQAVLCRAGSGFSLVYRTSTNGSDQTAAPTVAGTLPQWLKLVRSGNAISAYVSADNSTWTQVGSTLTISMQNEVLIGLAVSSGSNEKISTATFDNLP